MKDKIQISEFDVAKYLTDEKAIAEYLWVILEENNPELLMLALKNIVRSKQAFFVGNKKASDFSGA